DRRPREFGPRDNERGDRTRRDFGPRERGPRDTERRDYGSRGAAAGAEGRDRTRDDRTRDDYGQRENRPREHGGDRDRGPRGYGPREPGQRRFERRTFDQAEAQAEPGYREDVLSAAEPEGPPREAGPAIPEEIRAEDLDSEVRAELRSLARSI